MFKVHNISFYFQNKYEQYGTHCVTSFIEYVLHK